MHALIALAAAEPHAELFLPAWAFPLIVAAAFVVLGFVSWSFRDVNNRHADRDPFPADPHAPAEHENFDSGQRPGGHH